MLITTISLLRTLAIYLGTLDLAAAVAELGA